MCSPYVVCVQLQIKTVVLVLMVHCVLCEQLTLHVIVVFHQPCRILRTLPTIPCSKARQLLLFPHYCLLHLHELCMSHRRCPTWNTLIHSLYSLQSLNSHALNLPDRTSQIFRVWPSNRYPFLVLDFIPFSVLSLSFENVCGSVGQVRRKG